MTSVIDDEEFDTLRSIADRLRMEAQQTSYGFFTGGDPRDFTPDAEVCTEAEIEAHATDCASWEAGNQVDKGSCCRMVGNMILTVAHYGMGVNSYNDEVLMKVAQDLDDVIDRIRQVTT